MHANEHELNEGDSRYGSSRVGVSRDFLPQWLKPAFSMPLYRRSKDLLHPAAGYSKSCARDDGLRDSGSEKDRQNATQALGEILLRRDQTHYQITVAGEIVEVARVNVDVVLLQ